MRLCEYKEGVQKESTPQLLYKLYILALWIILPSYVFCSQIDLLNTGKYSLQSSKKHESSAGSIASVANTQWSIYHATTYQQYDESVIQYSQSTTLSGFLPFFVKNQSYSYGNVVIRELNNQAQELDLGFLWQQKRSENATILFTYIDYLHYQLQPHHKGVNYLQTTTGASYISRTFDAQIRYYRPITQGWRDIDQGKLFVRQDPDDNKSYLVGYDVLEGKSNKGVDSSIAFNMSTYESTQVRLEAGGYYFYTESNELPMAGPRMTLSLQQQARLNNSLVDININGKYQVDKSRGYQGSLGFCVTLLGNSDVSKKNRDYHDIKIPEVRRDDALVISKRSDSNRGVAYNSNEQLFHRVKLVSEESDMLKYMEDKEKPLFLLTQNIRLSDYHHTDQTWKNITIVSSKAKGKIGVYGRAPQTDIQDVIASIWRETGKKIITGPSQYSIQVLEGPKDPNRHSRQHYTKQEKSREAIFCTLENAVVEGIDFISDTVDQIPAVIAKNQVDLHNVVIYSRSHIALQVEGNTTISSSQVHTNAQGQPAILATTQEDGVRNKRLPKLYFKTGNKENRITTVGDASNGLSSRNFQIFFTKDKNASSSTSIHVLGDQSKGIAMQGGSLSSTDSLEITTKNAEALELDKLDKVDLNGKQILRQMGSGTKPAMNIQANTIKIDSLLQVWTQGEALKLQAKTIEAKLHDQSTILGRGNLIETKGNAKFYTDPSSHVTCNTATGAIFLSDGKLQVKGLHLSLNDEATAYNLATTTTLESENNHYTILKDAENVSAIQLNNHMAYVNMQYEKFVIQDRVKDFTIFSAHNSPNTVLGSHMVKHGQNTQRGSYYKLSGNLTNTKISLEKELYVGGEGRQIVWLETDQKNIGEDILQGQYGSKWSGIVHLNSDQGSLVKWHGELPPQNGFGITEAHLGRSATFIAWDQSVQKQAVLNLKLNTGKDRLYLRGQTGYQGNLLDFNNMYALTDDVSITDPLLHVHGAYSLILDKAETSKAIQIRDIGRVKWVADTLAQVNTQDYGAGLYVSGESTPTSIIIAPEKDACFDIKASNNTEGIAIRHAGLQLDSSHGYISSKSEKKSALHWQVGDLINGQEIIKGKNRITLHSAGQQSSVVFQNIGHDDDILRLEGKLSLSSSTDAPALTVYTDQMHTQKMVLQGEASMRTQGPYAIVSELEENYFLSTGRSTLDSYGDEAVGFISAPKKSNKKEISAWFLPDGDISLSEQGSLVFTKGLNNKSTWSLTAHGKNTIGHVPQKIDDNNKVTTHMESSIVEAESGWMCDGEKQKCTMFAENTIFYARKGPSFSLKNMKPDHYMKITDKGFNIFISKSSIAGEIKDNSGQVDLTGTAFFSNTSLASVNQDQTCKSQWLEDMLDKPKDSKIFLDAAVESNVSGRFGAALWLNRSSNIKLFNTMLVGQGKGSSALVFDQGFTKNQIEDILQTQDNRSMTGQVDLSGHHGALGITGDNTKLIRWGEGDILLGHKANSLFFSTGKNAPALIFSPQDPSRNGQLVSLNNCGVIASQSTAIDIAPIAMENLGEDVKLDNYYIDIKNSTVVAGRETGSIALSDEKIINPKRIASIPAAIKVQVPLPDLGNGQVEREKEQNRFSALPLEIDLSGSDIYSGGRTALDFSENNLGISSIKVVAEKKARIIQVNDRDKAGYGIKFATGQLAILSHPNLEDRYRVMPRLEGVFYFHKSGRGAALLVHGLDKEQISLEGNLCSTSSSLSMDLADGATGISLDYLQMNTKKIWGTFATGSTVGVKNIDMQLSGDTTTAIALHHTTGMMITGNLHITTAQPGYGQRGIWIYDSDTNIKGYTPLSDIIGTSYQDGNWFLNNRFTSQDFTKHIEKNYRLGKSASTDFNKYSNTGSFIHIDSKEVGAASYQGAAILIQGKEGSRIKTRASIAGDILLSTAHVPAIELDHADYTNDQAVQVSGIFTQDIIDTYDNQINYIQAQDVVISTRGTAPSMFIHHSVGASAGTMLHPNAPWTTLSIYHKNTENNPAYPVIWVDQAVRFGIDISINQTYNQMPISSVLYKPTHMSITTAGYTGPAIGYRFPKYKLFKGIVGPKDQAFYLKTDVKNPLHIFEKANSGSKSSAVVQILGSPELNKLSSIEAYFNGPITLQTEQGSSIIKYVDFDSISNGSSKVDLSGLWFIEQQKNLVSNSYKFCGIAITGKDIIWCKNGLQGEKIQK